MIETSVKTYARAIGIFLILTMIGGYFGEVHVPSQIITSDPAANVAQLRNEQALFRLGFAAYMIEAFSDVVLAWLFYVLLRPVHRDLALLSALFGIVSMTLFAVTQMFYWAAPMFLKGSRYLAAFPVEQQEALANSFLFLHANLSGLFMLFYGTGWIIRGYLTIRSTYLPRLLGVVMIIAGAGFAVQNVFKVLAPQFSSTFLLAPMFVNALAVAAWMLVRGVNDDKWNSAVRAAGPTQYESEAGGAAS
jgi:hypothetical protein